MTRLDYEPKHEPDGPPQWPGPVVAAVYLAAIVVLVWVLWRITIGGRGS